MESPVKVVADNNVKLTIIMIETGLNKEKAKELLYYNKGFISKALKSNL